MTQWISIQDKLPDPNEKVLIYDKCLGVLMGWLNRSAYDNLNITHWQPLPLPPSQPMPNGYNFEVGM